MRMATLRSRLSFVKRLPLASTQPSSAGHKSSSAALVRSKGDLRITVRNAPSGQPPRMSEPSAHGPVELPKDGAGSSRGEPTVSFGAPEEDRMSIAASEEGLTPDEAGETAYSAVGQTASALHAMAIWQVHQAKALKQLHHGGPDPRLMQELRTATDFALRATKVTARSLGQVMSTMVVQERHLWLNLPQMSDADKVRFLDAPISQAGLFSDTVEDFALQFSAVQKQTEAIKHILPR
ncbi:hypothetical protein M9458_046653, partial [Cirrhinus mrigala]